MTKHALSSVTSRCYVLEKGKEYHHVEICEGSDDGNFSYNEPEERTEPSDPARETYAT